MFNFDFVYLLLNLLLLVTFLVTGKCVSKLRENGYWLKVFWSIIAFTFVMGMRYMRGNDYYHYSCMFEYGFDQGKQPLFVAINSILKFWGVNQYTCFIAYSFIESICMMAFLKHYKKYGCFIVPLMLIATIQFNEYQIRQALSYSFVYLALINLFNFNVDTINNKRLFTLRTVKILFPFVFWSLTALSIHTANVLIILLFTGFYFFVRKPIPWQIAIPLVFFSQYMFSAIFDFNYLNGVLSFAADIDDRASVYVANSEKWFSSNAFEEKYTRNAIVGFVECLGVSSLIFLGDNLIKLRIEKKQEFVTIYNIFILGTLIVMGFRQLEILNRIGSNLAFWWFYPLSLVLFHKNELYCIKFGKISYLGLLWFSYEYIKYLFMRGEMVKFLWDK